MNVPGWFEQLFGFPEGAYRETQARFVLEVIFAHHGHVDEEMRRGIEDSSH